MGKISALILLIAVFALNFTACGGGGSTITIDTGSFETTEEGGGSSGLNADSSDAIGGSGSTGTSRAATTKASVFVCGTPSMMGFADWEYDTVYETALSLLLDSLGQYSLSLYRYDEYGASAVNDASQLKEDARGLSFYTALGQEAEASIPQNVSRTKNDQMGSLSGIDGYFSAEEVETLGAESPYPLQNAIKMFSKDALNVVVTDLYEMRDGGFSELSALKDYDVGVLAVRSEYAGTMPAFASDGNALNWGSPRTGYYKSHAVKTGSYTKDDGTTGHYNYNAFTGYAAAERTKEDRTFYILLAGNGIAVGDAVNDVRARVMDKYANSSTVTLELGVFGIYGSQCENVQADAAGKTEYIAYTEGDDEEFYEGSDFSFEIQERDDVPAFAVSAEYHVDTGTGAVIPKASDFEVVSTCTKVNGAAQKEEESKPTLAVESGGDGYIVPVLAYSPEDLPKGEYLYETTIYAKPVGKTAAKADFLGQWGIEIDDGTLREILSNYEGGSEEGVGAMRAFMQKTPGLGNLFENVKDAPTKMEALHVKIYFNVV
jgi:hypothetical protein